MLSPVTPQISQGLSTRQSASNQNHSPSKLPRRNGSKLRFAKITRGQIVNPVDRKREPQRDRGITGLDDGAALLALLAALFGLALVLAHDRDTGQTVRHLWRLSSAAAAAKRCPVEEGGSGGGVGLSRRLR